MGCPETSNRLIIISGVPGTGKSTVSEGLARAARIPVLSVDPIEAAMWRAGLKTDQTGLAAYYVAQAMAAENLKLGLSVILDAVNPVEAAREMWRSLAAETAVPLYIVECVCRDEKLHQSRIENRVRDIPGMAETSWAKVKQRRAEYEDWIDDRLVLDSTNDKPDLLISKALEYVHQN